MDPEPLPELPEGRWLRLSRRGWIFFREVAGPPGAPVLLLLHGWLASATLNWRSVFAPLGERFRVIAPDLRGHGRGIRSLRRFRLEDCADDADALLEELGVASAIAVGYSMGGAVAQLLWRRHPSRVAGLVLCATSHRPVRGRPAGRLAFRSALSAAAATTRVGQVANFASRQLKRLVLQRIEPRSSAQAGYALLELWRHDARMLLEAGAALGRYRADDWFASIDVPTAVVVTTRDRAILPEDQMGQALHIRGARVYCLDLGHGACTDPRFEEALVPACLDVAARAARAKPPDRRARERERLRRRVDALLA
jgi:3-oxoadipate enol-lactonase